MKFTPTERLEVERIRERGNKCAALCAVMDKLDRTESRLVIEADALCDVLDLIRDRINTRALSLKTGVRLMDSVFDLLESIIAERKIQIEKHQRQ